VVFDSAAAHEAVECLPQCFRDWPNASITNYASVDLRNRNHLGSGTREKTFICDVKIVALKRSLLARKLQLSAYVNNHPASDPFEDAIVDGGVDPGPRQSTDLEQIPALGLELRHVLDFLFAVVLEIDDDAVMRSNRVVVDSIDQAKLEAGEFVGVIESGRRHWDDFVEMRDVVAGFKPGRANAREITLFKSLGLAIEDVAIAKVIYERAAKQGMGSRLKA